MLIPHVVQTEADKVYVNVLNVQASSVTDGEVVVWDIVSPDGVRVTQAATDTLGLFVGLAQGTIPASGYGLAQAYGYKSVGQFSTDTATAAAPAGALLQPTAAVDYLSISAATGVSAVLAAASGAVGFCYAAEARTDTIALADTKVLIRAL